MACGGGSSILKVAVAPGKETKSEKLRLGPEKKYTNSNRCCLKNEESNGVYKWFLFVWATCRKNHALATCGPVTTLKKPIVQNAVNTMKVAK